MGLQDPGDLTRVLQAVRDGDAKAERLLFERVYNELRRMARARLSREYSTPTMLQTTGLVHEAYVRLVREEPANWQNRSHFFGAAVEAMRRILIDYARARKAERRGGGAPKVTLEEGQAAAEPSFDVLALNEALDRLAELRPRAAKVVGFRFFLGMTVKETAELLRIAPRTVDLDWSFANAWLRRELAGPEGNPRQESPDAP